MPSTTMTTAGVPVARSGGGSGPRGRAFRAAKQTRAVEARKLREIAARRRRARREYVLAEADPITAALPEVASTRAVSDVRLKALLAPLRQEHERGARSSARMVRDALMSSYGMTPPEAAAIIRAHRADEAVRLPERFATGRRAAA